MSTPKPVPLKPVSPKPVGFKTDPNLWREFKARVYREGLEIGKVLTALVKLYLSDVEVHDKAKQLALEEMAG